VGRGPARPHQVARPHRPQTHHDLARRRRTPTRPVRTESDDCEARTARRTTDRAHLEAGSAPKPETLSVASWPSVGCHTGRLRTPSWPSPDRFRWPHTRRKTGGAPPGLARRRVAEAVSVRPAMRPLPSTWAVGRRATRYRPVTGARPRCPSRGSRARRPARSGQPPRPPAPGTQSWITSSAVCSTESLSSWVPANPAAVA
jgi:hypothetical protein